MRLFFPLLLLIFAANVARAETAQERARAQNRRGMTQYDLGRYDAALQLFQSAYETFPDPKILFNVAQTYRKQRNYAPALESYRAYLRNLPDAPNRQVVERRIAEIEELLAAQTTSEQKPPEGVAPVPPPEPEPPSGATRNGPAPAPALSPSPRDVVPSDRPRWYRDRLAWIMGGTGIAAAVTGTAFLLRARAQKDEFATAPESRHAPLRDDIRQNQWIGGTAVGVGAALVAGAIVKFALVQRSSSNVEGHAGVAVLPTGVVAFGRF